MIDKANAILAPRMKSHWMAMAALAFVVVAAITVGVAGSPYLFQGVTLQSELATQVRATTGLTVTSSDPGRFELLPRPHIVMKGLHFSDPTGTLDVAADRLDGDVRLLPLLVGRLELSSATLVQPKLAIDLDGRPMRPDNTIGRALHDVGLRNTVSGRRLGVVTLVDGTATLKSKALAHDLAFDAVNVTIDWPDLDSPAAVTGTLSVEDTSATIAVWLAQPSSLMRGESSPLALRVEGTPLDLSANGDLSTAGSMSFRGNVALRAPSLPALFAFTGRRISPPAPFAHVVLNSDTSISLDGNGRPSIDLPSLHLRLDGNDYEGTLAFQGGAIPTLSGTLATEQLMLAPFLDRAPKLSDSEHGWTHEPIGSSESDPIDLDLRISATHLRLGPLAIDDAALGIITRNDRTEVALVDGKAYGGGVRGRVSIGVSGSDVSIRGTGSLADADAGSLTWDAFGRQVAVGTVSGSVNLETSGDSPAALMQHLSGSAKGHASDGEIDGIDIGQSLKGVAAKRPEPVLTALRMGRTPFQTLVLSLRVMEGVAGLEEGSMQGPDANVTLAGGSDIGKRSLDLRLIATSPGQAKTPEADRSNLRLGIKGHYNKIIVSPDRSGDDGLLNKTQ